MKFLILKCNTGEGHNSVAQAVAESLEAAGQSCEITDALAFLSERASEFVCSWHVRLYRHMPKLYGSGYRMAESHPAAFDEDSAVYKLLSAGAEKLREHVLSGGFDCIVCPHVIPSLMTTIMLKECPDMHPLTCNIATDYTCSPMTDESRLNIYFVPDGRVVPEFTAAGIPPEKLAVIDGIPVRREFYAQEDRTLAKRALGVPEWSPHLLMMFGSMGCGPMQRLTELLALILPKSAYMTVVCGTNETLEKKLLRFCEGRENVRVMGYVDDVPRLMSASDLFLTKPGGISTSEAAVKRLPMALMDTVGSCEGYNLRLFCASGGAVTADTPEELAGVCRELLYDQKALSDMSAALGRRENSADQVCRELLSAMGERGSA